MRIVITDCDHDAFDEERAVVAATGDELIIANATDPASLIANAAGADALVVQYATITAEILDALPQVRVVSRYGVGVDSVDIPAATARGVAVCNVPDYGTEAVSDHAIALALNAAREVSRLDRGLRAGKVDFPGVRPMHLIGDRVFGILGLAVSFLVGWGFLIGLVGAGLAIAALRRPWESRQLAVWALCLSLVSVVYSAGWLWWASTQGPLFG